MKNQALFSSDDKTGTVNSIISTSIISNNRLSRREKLVLVLTQKSKISLQNIVEREEIAPGEQFLPFPQYFQYIFLTKVVKLHSHL